MVVKEFDKIFVLYDDDELPTLRVAQDLLNEWLTRKALEKTDQNISAAARMLGVSRIWMNKLKRRYIDGDVTTDTSVGN